MRAILDFDSNIGYCYINPKLKIFKTITMTDMTDDAINIDLSRNKKIVGFELTNLEQQLYIINNIDGLIEKINNKIKYA